VHTLSPRAIGIKIRSWCMYAMLTSTISARGTTTIPKEVCEALHLKPGDTLRWDIDGRKVFVSVERRAAQSKQSSRR
jgi:AbrB family looped-hinge helix DNA binding protein